MEDDVEFDRDTLLLYDAPFGVVFDMLGSGFKRLSIVQDQVDAGYTAAQ